MNGTQSIQKNSIVELLETIDNVVQRDFRRYNLYKEYAVGTKPDTEATYLLINLRDSIERTNTLIDLTVTNTKQNR